MAAALAKSLPGDSQDHAHRSRPGQGDPDNKAPEITQWSFGTADAERSTQAIALSTNWRNAERALPAPRPIWVACGLPSRNRIRVGMLRTP